MPMLEQDLKLLNLRPSTLHNLKRNYHSLVLKYHPDRKTGKSIKFKEIHEAYQRLKNYDIIKHQIDRIEKEYVGSK